MLIEINIDYYKNKYSFKHFDIIDNVCTYQIYKKTKES